jgi:hypothetical protein
VETEIERLRSATPEALWSADLDAFETVYRAFVSEREEADKATAEESSNSRTESAPKKIVRRRRRQQNTFIPTKR